MVKTPLSLSLSDLKALAEPVGVVAVNQCSGNSRGFFTPRVFGAQLANGSMGNARWVGAPLRKVLEKAGVDPSARQVTFDGLDRPVLPSTSDFRKALEIEHALSDEPLLAWSMNGVELPFLNGYPVKLIVPGYFGTYWVKHLAAIEVIGIKTVEISLDGGQSWRGTTLGPSLGRFSFRAWHTSVRFTNKGPAVLKVRATNLRGEVQPETAEWNPAGYRRHVIESTSVTVI